MRTIDSLAGDANEDIPDAVRRAYPAPAAAWSPHSEVLFSAPRRIGGGRQLVVFAFDHAVTEGLGEYWSMVDAQQAYARLFVRAARRAAEQSACEAQTPLTSEKGDLCLWCGQPRPEHPFNAPLPNAQDESAQMFERASRRAAEQAACEARTPITSEQSDLCLWCQHPRLEHPFAALRELLRAETRASTHEHR